MKNFWQFAQTSWPLFFLNAMFTSAVALGWGVFIDHNTERHVDTWINKYTEDAVVPAIQRTEADVREKVANMELAAKTRMPWEADCACQAPAPAAEVVVYQMRAPAQPIDAELIRTEVPRPAARPVQRMPDESTQDTIFTVTTKAYVYGFDMYLQELGCNDKDRSVIKRLVREVNPAVKLDADLSQILPEQKLKRPTLPQTITRRCKF